MAKTLTAADRSALIRLASSLEKGSEQRRVILAALPSSGWVNRTLEPTPSAAELNAFGKRWDELSDRALDLHEEIARSPYWATLWADGSYAVDWITGTANRAVGKRTKIFRKALKDPNLPGSLVPLIKAALKANSFEKRMYNTRRSDRLLFEKELATAERAMARV
jgi:hypothetical protein